MKWSGTLRKSSYVAPLFRGFVVIAVTLALWWYAEQRDESNLRRFWRVNANRVGAPQNRRRSRSLLDAQRFERLRVGGMPRGDDAREHRDRRQQQHDDGNRQRVHGRDAVKLARDETRQAERRGDADQYPDPGDDEPFAYDETNDVPPSGAERRSYAELVGAA